MKSNGKSVNKAVVHGSGYSGAVLGGISYQPFSFSGGFRYAPPAR